MRGSGWVRPASAALLAALLLGAGPRGAAITVPDDSVPPVCRTESVSVPLTGPFEAWQTAMVAEAGRLPWAVAWDAAGPTALARPPERWRLALVARGLRVERSVPTGHGDASCAGTELVVDVGVELVDDAGQVLATGEGSLRGPPGQPLVVEIVAEVSGPGLPGMTLGRAGGQGSAFVGEPDPVWIARWEEPR